MADSTEHKHESGAPSSSETLLSSVQKTSTGDPNATSTQTNQNPDPAAQQVAEKAIVDALSPEEKTKFDALSDEEKKTFLKEKYEAATKKSEGAPEKYSDFTLPEGVTLAAEDQTAFTALAKESNLSQAQAQKFIDMAVAHTKKTMDSRDAAWQAERDTWVEKIKSDSEYGGANFDKTMAYVSRAVKFAEEPELKLVFDSGFGDHPALIRAFAKFGKRLSEDKLTEGNSPTSDKSTADVLFGQGK